MITAAASAFPYLRLSFTSVPATRRGAHGATAVTCGYTAKVTIYNCRNFGECRPILYGIPPQSRKDVNHSSRVARTNRQPDFATL